MTEIVPPAGAKPHLMSVQVVVPVYNEASGARKSVRALRSYLDDYFPFPITVTIADNASTDSTRVLACRLAADLEGCAPAPG